jgi:hypothetical protein
LRTRIRMPRRCTRTVSATPSIGTPNTPLPLPWAGEVAAQLRVRVLPPHTTLTTPHPSRSMGSIRRHPACPPLRPPAARNAISRCTALSRGPPARASRFACRACAIAARHGSRASTSACLSARSASRQFIATAVWAAAVLAAARGDFRGVATVFSAATPPVTAGRSSPDTCPGADRPAIRLPAPSSLTVHGLDLAPLEVPLRTRIRMPRRCTRTVSATPSIGTPNTPLPLPWAGEVAAQRRVRVLPPHTALTVPHPPHGPWARFDATPRARRPPPPPPRTRSRAAPD